MRYQERILIVIIIVIKMTVQRGRKEMTYLRYEMRKIWFVCRWDERGEKEEGREGKKGDWREDKQAYPRSPSTAWDAWI